MNKLPPTAQSSSAGEKDLKRARALKNIETIRVCLGRVDVRLATAMNIDEAYAKDALSRLHDDLYALEHFLGLGE